MATNLYKLKCGKAAWSGGSDFGVGMKRSWLYYCHTQGNTADQRPRRFIFLSQLPAFSLVSSDCEYLWAVNCYLHTETSGLYCGQTLSANTRVLYSLRVLMLYCTHSCMSSGFRKKTNLFIIC